MSVNQQSRVYAVYFLYVSFCHTYILNKDICALQQLVAPRETVVCRATDTELNTELQRLQQA